MQKARVSKSVGGSAIFDWRGVSSTNDYYWNATPISCNALGAILLKIGQENLAKDGFNSDWLSIICKYLDEDPFWVNRFVLGFDYGTQVYIISTKDGKDTRHKDKVSPLGLKLAAKYIPGRK